MLVLSFEVLKKYLIQPDLLLSDLNLQVKFFMFANMSFFLKNIYFEFLIINPLNYIPFDIFLNRSISKKH